MMLSTSQVEECFVTGCGGEEGNGKVRLCNHDDDDDDNHDINDNFDDYDHDDDFHQEW